MLFATAAALSLFLMLLAAAPAGGQEYLYVARDGQGVLLYTNVPPSPLPPRLPRLPVTEGARRRFRPLIEAAAIGEGVDHRLLTAIIQVESAFNPGATSRRGAQGLMQLMPGTAEEYAVRDPYDPEENIRGGARYLRRLLDLFAGNLPLTLAAYNAGEAAVQRFGGIPPFGETREYVHRVQARYRALGGSHPLARPRLAAPDPASRVYRILDREGRLRYTNLPPVLSRSMPRN
ncbi:MAG: lytic transglycosylase domain-containing protein [candidate division NC10 bacterium]|nr:lytic transglycosylase domain-containing protein [candidate division NC10 bacterium]